MFNNKTDYISAFLRTELTWATNEKNEYAETSNNISNQFNFYLNSIQIWGIFFEKFDNFFR